MPISNATATCPRCKNEMPQMAAACPHCGYDFPLLGKPKPVREGIAYSPLADIALIVGQLAAVLGCVSLLFALATAIYQREWIGAFATLIAFFLVLSVFVVLQRVSDMD